MASAAPNGSAKPTSILHRTPKSPPIASSAQGIYITLDNGKTIIDAVGGAAVACIGNGHPAVVQAIKDQADKMSCMLHLLSCSIHSAPMLITCMRYISDVYNMQLSNEPAEELAQYLVESSGGAFDLVGFVSGGASPSYCI